MFEVYWEIGHPSSWELSEQVLVLKLMSFIHEILNAGWCGD